MADNLVEGLQSEIKRNRELLDLYRSIPTGAFGAAMIERDINAAIDALGSGDIALMIKAYNGMKNNE